MINIFRGRKTFISRQIGPVTLLALLACLSDYASSIISTLIIGGKFGEIGLVIVGVTAPVETFRLFICDFLCGSAVYLRNVSIAEGDKDKGARMIGSTLLIVSAVGVLLFFGMYFGAEFYLSFFNLSPETMEPALAYVKAMASMPLISILMYYSYEFVFRLGTKFSSTLMVLTSSVGVAVCGLLFIPSCGIVGMAYGCIAANGITAVIGAITIFLHRNEFSFKFSLRKSDLIELVRYGFAYSQDTFYYPVYSAVMNVFLGNVLGEAAIAVFAIIECVSEICSVFYGVSYALENHLAYYVGEKNTDGIRKSLEAALRLQFIIAVSVTLLVFIFARPVAAYMGMEEAYAAETIFALRIYSLSFVFQAWLCFNSDFYCANEQTIACISLFLSKTILVGIGVSVGLGLAFGSTGVYIGKALEAPLALLITYALTRKVYKSKSIYILPEDDGSIVSFDYNLTEKEIMDTNAKLDRHLESREIPKDIRMRILLAFEEVNMLTLENNKPGIYGECTVFFKPGAPENNKFGMCGECTDCIKPGALENNKPGICGECTDCVKPGALENIKPGALEMILRDSGKLYDISNADNKLSSLRNYVVSSMVHHYQNTSHINASNTNRIVLRFPVGRE